MISVLDNEPALNVIVFVAVALLALTATEAAAAGSLAGTVLFASMTGSLVLMSLFATAARFWVLALALYVGTSLLPSVL